MNLTEFCIKRPVTTVMFFAALMLLGIVSFTRMNVDLYPEVTYPTLNVNVSYPGAGPQEIEQMITIPLEQAVATVNGIKNITAVSQEGSARVTAEFDWGRDLRDATDDLRSSLDRVERRLPEGASRPTVFKWNPSMAPILSLGLSSTQINEYDLRQFAEEDLTNLLQRAEGVASVDAMGGKKREISIRLHRDRLRAFGVTAEQITNALRNENAMLPAGHLITEAGDYLLRTQGEFKSLDEIRSLVVTVRNGVPIYLGTLADIEEGFEEEQSLVRIDGKPGIVVTIRKRSDANTVATADLVYKHLEDIRRRYPDVQIRILRDNSIYIRNSIQSVILSALQGGILAALVLLFFLVNVRMTIFAGVVMPIAILATIILAYFSKMTLNTISLGGLALGVGMLVDNTVVVLDNIFRHHHHGNGDVVLAAREGTREMGPALIASTLTTICVFFPLVFLTGRDGIIYKELSNMVIYSLLCSLFVAITLIPMLCTKFLKARDLDEDDRETQNIKGKLFGMQHRWETAYEKSLRWSLKNKGKVLIAAGIVFLMTLSLYPLIGTELLQASDEGVFSVNIQLPSGTQLDVTSAQAESLSERVRELVPEVENEEVTVGGRWGQAGETHRAFLTFRLVKKDQRSRSTQQIVELLQREIQIPGAQLRISPQSSMRMLYGGSNTPVVVEIYGHDQNLAKQVSNLVIDKLAKIPGVVNPSGTRDEERPELIIEINRQRAADMGVTAAQIANALQTHVEGRIATIYRKDGREYQVRVNLRKEDRMTWRDLEQVMVNGRSGPIPLTSLVRFSQGDGKVSIERKGQQRMVAVEAGIAERDLGSVIRDVQAALDHTQLPEGITLRIAGDYEEQQKSQREMLMVLALALILVYMVMASQFERYLDPLLIMLSVPFGLSGVMLILFLTDTPINSQVYLGLIMLGGIVVNNAIVLISYFRILLDQGKTLEEAVITGGRSRLRPILMTTVTTVLGLIPLALGIREGGEAQAPLARTVIGGLTFSMVLTLFLIPTIFAGVESMRVKRQARKGKKRAVSTVVIGLILICVLGGSVAAESRSDAMTMDLTVERAVEMGLRNSQAGKILAHRREMAYSIYKQAMADHNLQVFGELSTEVYDDTKSSTKDNDSYKATLTAEKRTYLSNLRGAKALNDQIEEGNLKIALRSLDAQEQELILKIVEAFQNVVKAQDAVRIAGENLERSRHLNEETLARTHVGLTDIVDVKGAEAGLFNAVTQVQRSEKVLSLEMTRLKRLIGVEADTELCLVAPGIDGGPSALEHLVQRGLQQRSEVIRAEENLKRTEALLRLAELSQRLRIELKWEYERDSLRAGLGVTNQNSKKEVDDWQILWNTSLVQTDLLQPKEDWGTIKLNFKYTFFDGGAMKERIRQAQLLREQTTSELNQVQIDVSLDVEKAYYDYLQEKEALLNEEIQYDYRRTHWEASEAKMRAGLASIKDVLDAQVLMNQSAIAKERAASELYMAKIRLIKALGMLKPDSKWTMEN